MFKIGDFIEVKDRGHVAIITNMDQDRVWVEWEHTRGISFDYKKHEAYPLWEPSNKHFTNVCPVKHGQNTSMKILNLPKSNQKYSEDLLDKFERMLDEPASSPTVQTKACKHEYLNYWGATAKDAFDYCKHCDHKMPYNHLKVKR